MKPDYSDHDYYELVDTTTNRVIGGREFMHRDEANRRNRDDLDKMGCKHHEWRKCDVPPAPQLIDHPNLFNR